MCEYRLGRPDKAKDKMERFIEETRRILMRRAYELTQPRTMDQTLIAAFPSVFLVYFQWHHNLRTIYPKVPKKQVEENNLRVQRLQAEDKLKNRIYADDVQKVKFQEIVRDKTQRGFQDTDRQQRSQKDKEQLKMTIRSNVEKVREEAEITDKKREQNIATLAERSQRQM